MSRKLGSQFNYKHEYKSLKVRHEALAEAFERMQQELKAAGDKPAPPARGKKAQATTEPLPPAGLVRKLAFELFEQHGGKAYDDALRSARYKVRAFFAQRSAADGHGKAYGPDMSVYESRMTESNIAKLMKQKDQLYRRCELEATWELQDLADGRSYTPPEAEPEYTTEQINAYVHWFCNPATAQPTEEIAAMHEKLGDESTLHPQSAEVLERVRQDLQVRFPHAKTVGEALNMLLKESPHPVPEAAAECSAA